MNSFRLVQLCSSFIVIPRVHSASADRVSAGFTADGLTAVIYHDSVQGRLKYSTFELRRKKKNAKSKKRKTLTFLSAESLQAAQLT